MLNNINNSYLNKFLRDIKLKKQYFKNLKTKMELVSNIKEKNYTSLYPVLVFNKKYLLNDNNLITYIIDITFSRSNTYVHVMDFSGKLKFFYSSGSFNYSGKSKRSRYTVFRNIYRILLTKLKFLQGKPIAIHLKNVGFNKFWIIKKLKKRFFVRCVKSFNIYPHNGCRKKKIRRKKFKKKEEMAEWFKAADCKSVEILSPRRFESCFLQY